MDKWPINIRHALIFICNLCLACPFVSLFWQQLQPHLFSSSFLSYWSLCPLIIPVLSPCLCWTFYHLGPLDKDQVNSMFLIAFWIQEELAKCFIVSFCCLRKEFASLGKGLPGNYMYAYINKYKR